MVTKGYRKGVYERVTKGTSPGGPGFAGGSVFPACLMGPVLEPVPQTFLEPPQG